MPLAGDETDVLALSMRSCGRSFGSRQFASTLLTLLLSFAWRRICRVSSSGPGPSVFAVAGMYRSDVYVSVGICCGAFARSRPCIPCVPIIAYSLGKDGFVRLHLRTPRQFRPRFCKLLFFFVQGPLLFCLPPHRILSPSDRPFVSTGVPNRFDCYLQAMTNLAPHHTT